MPTTYADPDDRRRGVVTMCMPVQCQRCGKTTWSGCGEHVADVRAQVAADNWCQCPENADPKA
ncbi:hypothetical protein [Janibacter anophelis]|uniref:hypothetical protein n=1 Tax=Janibacter anophelis TaxID=319054 RepID=UPI000AE98129|nr:hypothetical protein [Janibacter anophelis]